MVKMLLIWMMKVDLEWLMWINIIELVVMDADEFIQKLEEESIISIFF